MKLYYSPGACSLAVRITLNELGFQFEDEAVNLRTKVTASGEDYLKINPKGAVPALVLDNGDLLTEVQAILQYLADLANNHQLLASVNDPKRYHTLEVMNYVSTELHKSLGFFYNPTLSNEFKTNVLLPAIMARFTYLNHHLENKPFLMGVDFTIPDAYLFVILGWARYFKIDFGTLTALDEFYKRMKLRPSVVESIQQEKV